MAGCGTCIQECTCAFQNGTNTTVTGTGSQQDPFVVNATVVTADSDTVDMSGVGTALSPVTGSVTVSGQIGNDLVARPQSGSNPGLYVTVPIKSVNGPDGAALTPDGAGNVAITAASVGAGLGSAFPHLTYDPVLNKFAFTPSASEGYVWASVANNPQWVDPSTLIPVPHTTVANGESTFAREIGLAATWACATGTLHMMFLTAHKTQTIQSIQVMSGTTANATGATTMRFGVYSVGSTYSLLASTTHDAAVLGAASTAYKKTFTSGAFTKQAGQIYAIGILVIGHAGTASVAGISVQASTTDYRTLFYATNPAMMGNLPSQTSLPASFAAASVVQTDNFVPFFAWLRED